MGALDKEILGRLRLMAPLVQHGIQRARGQEAPQPRAMQRAQRNMAAHSFKVTVDDILQAGMKELIGMQRGRRLA